MRFAARMRAAACGFERPRERVSTQASRARRGLAHLWRYASNERDVKVNFACCRDRGDDGHARPPKRRPARAELPPQAGLGSGRAPAGAAWHTRGCTCVVTADARLPRGDGFKLCGRAPKRTRQTTRARRACPEGSAAVAGRHTRGQHPQRGAARRAVEQRLRARPRVSRAPSSRGGSLARPRTPPMICFAAESDPNLQRRRSLLLLSSAEPDAYPHTNPPPPNE